MKRQNAYSLGEEIFNWITHGLGFIMSLAVCIFFLAKGAQSDCWITTFSFILYLFGVCSSYAASTIYHAIPGERIKAKAHCRQLFSSDSDSDKDWRRACMGLGDLRVRMAQCFSGNRTEFPQNEDAELSGDHMLRPDGTHYICSLQAVLPDMRSACRPLGCRRRNRIHHRCSALQFQEGTIYPFSVPCIRHSWRHMPYDRDLEGSADVCFLLSKIIIPFFVHLLRCIKPEP